MSIATVITEGFGSFGSIPLVVTMGYAIGDSPIPPDPPAVSNASGGFPYWPDPRRRKRDDEDKNPAEEVIEQAVEVAARKVVAKILAPRPVPSVADLERAELAAALDRVNVARTAAIEAAMRLEVSRVLAHHKRLMAEDDELLLM